MKKEQILLFKNKDGAYIPCDTINKDLCVLSGNKERVLERIKKSIEKFYSKKVEPIKFINADKLIIAIEYDEQYKFTICNSEGILLGNTFVDCFIDDFNNSSLTKLIAYENNGKYGFMNIETGEMIEKNWKEVSNFHEGLAAVQNPDNNKWGYINENMELVIDYKFDEAMDFSDGMAVTKKYVSSSTNFDSTDLLLTEEDQMILNEKFTENPNVKVVLYGYIDEKGELKIPYRFAYADGFSEGMAFTRTLGDYKKSDSNGFSLVSKVNYGGAFINKKGQRFEYLKSEPTRFHNGKSFFRIVETVPLAYEICIENGKMEIKEMNNDEYCLALAIKNSGKFDYKKQGEYRIEIKSNEDTEEEYNILTRKNQLIDINLYGNIEALISEFYENDKLDTNIYVYDFSINQIVPLTDFVIGSRNILSEEEVKPYVRKRKHM